MSRVAYNLEGLSLADPARSGEILQIIALKDANANSRFKDFQLAVDKLGDNEVVERSQVWIKSYQSYLIHFGSGMRDPYERSQYNGYVGASTTNQSTLPNELLASGMAHLDIRLKNRLARISLSDRTPSEKIEKMKDLRQALAHLEYALWASSSKVNLQQWMSDTMRPEIDRNSATFHFILEVFGENSPIYHLLSRP